jgi:ABC-2 type transport system permease protein
VRNSWTIFRKEMGSYFVSPVAYMLLASFTFIFGVLFSLILNGVVHAQAQMQFQMHAAPVNVNEEVIKPLIKVLSFISLFFIPLITMRLFSEEKRSGTFELLATSPVRDIEIILGKWLAAWAFYGCLLLAGSINLIVLCVYSHPDWKPLLASYVGLMLLVGCMLAIGIFVSSLTRNQIIAAVITFCVFFALWIISAVSDFGTSTIASALAYLSMNSHFDSFVSGVVQTKDVIFYISFAFLALFFTARYLESLRWRS